MRLRRVMSRRVLIGVALLVVMTGGVAVAVPWAGSVSGDPSADRDPGRYVHYFAGRPAYPAVTASPAEAAQPSASADTTDLPPSNPAPGTADQQAEVENWASETSPLFTLLSLTGSTASSGLQDLMASDGLSLGLTIPTVWSPL
jgi:hypothetical protein